MIRTVGVVVAVLPLMTGGVLAASTTTDCWIILASFILVVIPLLELLLLGGLSISLLLVLRLIPLDWLAVREADTRLLLPVITALHEPCDGHSNLIGIRWVARNIPELVLKASRVHAVNYKLPFIFRGNTCST